MKKYILIILYLLFICSFSLIFADTNGIWNFAKDLRFGNLGEDESGYGLDSSWYTFNNPVRFLKNITSDFSVLGNIYENGSKVSTLDSSGKVPLSQLPFHKGDLLSPINRLNLGEIDTYYFDISNLNINGSLKSNTVSSGIFFGLNNNIEGTFTSDANAISNNLLQGKTAYVNGIKINGTLPLSSVCSTAGGIADCSNAISIIEPGSFYSMIGSNSPITTNYCSRIDIFSDGTVTSTNLNSAGICKQILSCNLSSQLVSNYIDGTICGVNKVCSSGICVDSLNFLELNVQPNLLSCSDIIKVVYSVNHQVFGYSSAVISDGVNYFKLSGDKYNIIYAQHGSNSGTTYMAALTYHDTWSLKFENDLTKQVYTYDQTSSHHSNSRSGNLVSISSTPYRVIECPTDYSFLVK